MPSHRSEIDGASIVLIGKFNPAIFQPAWLGACNLLRKEEVEDAVIGMVNPQVTSFSAHWLTIQVLAERFTASTADPAQYQALRDLVACNSRFGSGQFIETLLSVSFADD